MLSCYIVDDETHAIETLVSYIERAPGLRLLGSSTNPVEAFELITTTINPDITFLDVDMPQLSGLDLAGLINDRTAIIFTTAFPNYALGAFEKNACDYLLKPISFERFLTSVKRVGALVKPFATATGDDYIFVKAGIKGKIIKVNLSDIWYAESIKNYIVLHTASEKHLIYFTMKELESALPQDQFLRVHKSYLVNVQKVKSINALAVNLEKDIQIPLGLMYRPAVQDFISTKLLTNPRQSS